MQEMNGFYMSCNTTKKKKKKNNSKAEEQWLQISISL